MVCPVMCVYHVCVCDNMLERHHVRGAETWDGGGVRVLPAVV